MGTICSKPSHLSGGHTLASPSPSHPSTTGRANANRQRQRHPQTADTRRSQAAAAAEERMKAASKRGVSAANPNSGRLAARLEASRATPLAPEPRRREDTIIEDWKR